MVILLFILESLAQLPSPLIIHDFGLLFLVKLWEKVPGHGFWGFIKKIYGCLLGKSDKHLFFIYVRCILQCID